MILRPVARHWHCPNCDLTTVTNRPDVHTPFHACRGLRGISAPMVPDGTRAKVETREREDYIGAERVQVDGDNRPVMSVVTTRDDGQDCAVLAPVASARQE